MSKQKRMLGIFGSLDAIKKARRGRRQAKKATVVKRVRFVSMKVSGSVVRKRLRETILRRLRFVNVCYARLLKMYQVAKEKKLSSVPKKASQMRGNLSLLLVLNGHGRAIQTKVVKASVSKAVSDCFYWHFQGYKLFPPQDRKKIQVALTLRVGE